MKANSSNAIHEIDAIKLKYRLYFIININTSYLKLESKMPGSK